MTQLTSEMHSCSHHPSSVDRLIKPKIAKIKSKKNTKKKNKKNKQQHRIIVYDSDEAQNANMHYANLIAGFVVVGTAVA